MSKIVKPLTNTTLKNLKPQARMYEKADGKGLFFRVYPTGAKSWFFKYKFNGKIKYATFGKYPALTLEVARTMAQEWRGLVYQKIDPIAYFQEQEAKQAASDISIIELADRWRIQQFAKKKAKEQTINENYRRLELHLFPLLGEMKIKDALLDKVLPVLHKLGHTNTTYKINISLKQMFQLAEDDGLIIKNPFIKIHENFSYPEHQHQPTIAPSELSELFATILNSNMKRQTALLIEWQLLTALRPMEAVRVEWGDVDFENAVLTIPAERMKGGKRAHKVLLSKQAVNVLAQMRQYSGNNRYIFPTLQAPYNKPMDTQAANVAIKRLGWKGRLTSHGIRSIASTYLHDLDRFSAEAIELCFSHDQRARNKVRAAYDRSEKLKSRAAIMQEWGDYVEAQKIEAMKTKA